MPNARRGTGSRAASYAAVAAGALLALSACSRSDGGGAAAASGCTRDTDCKGARICQNGACVTPPESASGSASATQPASQKQALGAAALGAPGDPYALAADGLPETIPAPGSTPPTTAEWNAVPREVTVRGSTALSCETKMLREWLRVTCRKSASGTPVRARKETEQGQQAFVFASGGLASIVVQVVRGKLFKGVYELDQGGGTIELTVDWRGGAQRPRITLEKR